MGTVLTRLKLWRAWRPYPGKTPSDTGSNRAPAGYLQCYGLAHLDLHFGNFFVDVASSQITLFDFDDCAYGWYLMDLAMLLFDVLVVYGGSDRERFGGRFLEHVLARLSVAEIHRILLAAQFPLFLKLLEIGVYITLYRTYDPSDSDGWVGKFMHGRKLRVEQDIPYVDLDFKGSYR